MKCNFSRNQSVGAEEINLVAAGGMVFSEERRAPAEAWVRVPGLEGRAG